MRNLAGYPRADDIVQSELARCGIPSFEVGDLAGEVGTSHKGVIITSEFRQYEFTRAWRYWVVRGSVPLRLARELYEHPVGRTDIRVAGHCGAPPPVVRALGRAGEEDPAHAREGRERGASWHPGYPGADLAGDPE